MSSGYPPSPEPPGSSRKLDESGFSLLEVIVALSIMAIGYITVLQLFSGGIQSVGMAEQYMRGVALADSKLSELALVNFNTKEYSGKFPTEEGYRWELDIAPYESSLNDTEAGIDLSEVVLRVLWNDLGRERTVELTTLRLRGESFPADDQVLKSIFQGGAVASPKGKEPPSPENPESPPDAEISGAQTPGVTGPGDARISGAGP